MAEFPEAQIQDVADRIRNLIEYHGASLVEAKAAAIKQLLENPWGAPPPEVAQALAEAGAARHQAGLNPMKWEGYHPLAKTGYWYPGPKSAPEAAKFWLGLKPSLPKSSLEAIDLRSTDIVGRLENPAGTKPIGTRGLVLGNVQSGKTTSFMSVIAKAADAGYRFFIVLTGMTNSLREQTQDRLNRHLVDPTSSHWIRLTTDEEDFIETKNADSFLGQHHDMKLIAVVKKNATVLKRLNKWLDGASEQTLAQTPILIIDDEADQASINTSDKSVTGINRQLRRLVKRRRAAYLAYTATPFANLLVDTTETEDIYPRSFVQTLPVADAYFGAERLFGRPGFADEDDIAPVLDVIREIEPEEVSKVRPPSLKHIDNWEAGAGPALVESLRWFVLGTAARRHRQGEATHSTMLIHTAMYALAHDRMRRLTADLLDELREGVSARKAVLLTELEEQWERELGKVDPERLGYERVSFATLLPEVEKVLESARVIMDNYASEDRLVYKDDDPQTVIVVGGNTLSRGLTLEGLVSSYFVRNASAYDTLLQMGRWFGYRVGWEDLPRIWMTDELRGWFRDLALVEFEVRDEIEMLVAQGMRPADIGIRIRQHPAMAITSAAKMRHAVTARVSYSGSRPQTVLFDLDNETLLDENLDAAAKLATEAAAVQKVEQMKGGYGFRDVPVETVTHFLKRYRVPAGTKALDVEGMLKYIELHRDSDELKLWNVVFVSPADSPNRPSRAVGPIEKVNLVTRAKVADGAFGDASSIRALMSEADLDADAEPQGGMKAAVLNEEAVQDAPASDGADDPDEPDAEAKVDKARRRSASLAAALDWRREHLGNKPVLLVYHIDRNSKAQQTPNSARVDLEAVEDVVGVALIFPVSEQLEAMVNYVSANVVDELADNSREDEAADIEAAEEASELEVKGSSS